MALNAFGKLIFATIRKSVGLKGLMLAGHAIAILMILTFGQESGFLNELPLNRFWYAHRRTL